MVLPSPLRRWLVPCCAWLPAPGTAHPGTTQSSELCLAQLDSQHSATEHSDPATVGRGDKGKEGILEGNVQLCSIEGTGARRSNFRHQIPFLPAPTIANLQAPSPAQTFAMETLIYHYNSKIRDYQGVHSTTAISNFFCFVAAIFSSSHPQVLQIPVSSKLCSNV